MMLSRGQSPVPAEATKWEMFCERQDTQRKQADSTRLFWESCGRLVDSLRYEQIQLIPLDLFLTFSDLNFVVPYVLYKSIPAILRYYFTFLVVFHLPQVYLRFIAFHLLRTKNWYPFKTLFINSSQQNSLYKFSTQYTLFEVCAKIGKLEILSAVYNSIGKNTQCFIYAYNN